MLKMWISPSLGLSVTLEDLPHRCYTKLLGLSPRSAILGPVDLDHGIYNN